ncbi:hypothetical protein JCM10213_008776 [Rhodosporidiobolus nylandii]
MPYIDSEGRIVHRAPPLQRALDFVHSIYLAVCLFIATLLNPNAARKMRPSSSLRDRERRKRDDDGPGRGGGGGRGVQGVNDSVNFSIGNKLGGGCCGGITTQ